MSKDMVFAALGTPDAVNETVDESGRHEDWIYRKAKYRNVWTQRRDGIDHRYRHPLRLRSLRRRRRHTLGGVMAGARNSWARPRARPSCGARYRGVHDGRAPDDKTGCAKGFERGRGTEPVSRREESNLRPMVYETIALPLSYAGSTIADYS
jgi:hypothetical protein